MISQMNTNSSRPSVLYGFGRIGMLCSSCTRLEGLLSLAHGLEPSLWPPEMRRTIDLAVSFVLQQQETKGKHKGGFRRQVEPIARSGHLEIRIDYVQHCVNVLVKYYQLLLKHNQLK